MTNKSTIILSYIASVSFYIAAIINFFYDSLLLSGVYIMIASCFLYSSVVKQNKNKKESKSSNIENTVEK